MHAHPTLGETVEEAVHGLAGHMINLYHSEANPCAHCAASKQVPMPSSET